jgi:glycosyltransferase involved in cell wall biosynthesis
MSTSSSLTRIGVVNHASGAWAAGSSYTRMLLHSLQNACRGTDIELYLFTPQGQPENLAANLQINSIPLSQVDCLPGERQLRKALRLGEKAFAFRGEPRLRRLLSIRDKSDVFGAAAENEISVVLPLFDVPPWNSSVNAIGWVPDFQHVYLPQFFSEAECAARDRSIRNLARGAKLVMLSSQSAREHFEAFVPGQRNKARVVSFPSLFAFTPPAGDPLNSVRRFSLPSKFALVANQFWAHKNHQVVIDAISLLKSRGKHIPVVMTGLPSDHRDPSNRNLSTLLQAIATADLAGQVIILGQVPYADLVNLMRAAAVVIQPSLFEGWSTIVQDAKAIGRPLICSDLSVHREQVPDAIGFFPTDGPEVLAEVLGENWGGLEPGPDFEREEKALDAEREFARRHGEEVLRVCREACSA